MKGDYVMRECEKIELTDITIPTIPTLPTGPDIILSGLW